MYLVLFVFSDSLFADSQFDTLCNSCCASEKAFSGPLLLIKRLVSSTYTTACA